MSSGKNKQFFVKQGITQTYITWYVLRTKQYIAYLPDDHIHTHTPQQIEEYLNKASREIHLKSWQFRQIIEAIRILFSLALKSTWVSVYWCHVNQVAEVA